jgi:hypothetical protein
MLIKQAAKLRNKILPESQKTFHALSTDLWLFQLRLVQLTILPGWILLMHLQKETILTFYISHVIAIWY